MRGMDKKTKTFAQQLRHHQTDAEKKAWYFLRNRNFLNLKFRRQHKIGSYVVDFCCLEKKLILELDGGGHAVKKDQDQKRSQYLESEGYTVLRFWNHEMLKDPEIVLEAIRQKLT